MKPRIAILSSLTDFSPAYSVAYVIEQIARMLKRGGYDYDLLALTYFNQTDLERAKAEGISIRNVLARVTLHDYQDVRQTEAAAKDEELRNTFGEAARQWDAAQKRENPEQELRNLAGHYRIAFEATKDRESFAAAVRDQADKTGAFDFDTQVDIALNGLKADDPRAQGPWVTPGLGYLEALKDYDVVITQDLMFLAAYLPLNKAIRECVKAYPKKRWLHWVHSGPDCGWTRGAVYPSTLRFEGCEQSLYVYLNRTQRLDVANHFRIPLKQVACVYNPVDVRDRNGFCEETRDLIDHFRLFEHDISQVYAFSTPRWRAKGIPALLALFGGWKRAGARVKLVLMNAHARNDDPVKMAEHRKQIADIEAEGRKYGMFPGVDFILTSRFAEQMMATARGDLYRDWPYSVPAKVKRDLDHCTNVFAFPTESECCSLVLAEASTSGKFVIINENVPSLREFVGPDVMHCRFSQNQPEKNPAYYADYARETWGAMQLNETWMNTTRARTKTYNADTIMKEQLEPLLYSGFDPGEK